MTRILGVALALAMLAAPAFAAAPAERVRGTVEAVDASSLIVRTDSGDSVKLALSDATKYATVVKSDLSKIQKDSFIGTATKGSGNFLVALEVVIFPPSMRGAGEGHYAWDKLPDTTMAHGRTVSSSMTNGTVQAAAPSGGGKVNSTMTNGNVQATSSRGGARELIVTYKGGQQKILVPPTAPIVAFEPAERAAIAPGAHVFVKTSEAAGQPRADFVAVGKDGLTPPM